MQLIEELIRIDVRRLHLLQMVGSLGLPDCYVAAGFVRNMVWDHLHGYQPSALNDVDVVFFDRTDTSVEYSERVRGELTALDAVVPWEVKNQAAMHSRNNDPPYRSTADAMSFWPEKETAIGVKFTRSGAIEVIAPFGVESLFAGYISRNPKRSVSLFQERISSKKWLDKWPLLKITL